MLTRVLLTHMLRTTLLVVGVGVLVGFLAGGRDLALAIGIGGVLVGGSGAVQIWLVGVLFDPAQGTPQKLVTGFALMMKLLLVAMVLWWVLTRTAPDQVGVLVGMALGLASLVIGVNRGSTSRAGQAAMDDAVREIQQRLDDE